MDKERLRLSKVSQREISRSTTQPYILRRKRHENAPAVKETEIKSEPIEEVKQIEKPVQNRVLPGRKPKHIRAKPRREQTPKKPTYQRDWKAYNQGQYNEYTYFNAYVSSLAATVEEPPREKKAGRKPIPFRDLLTCAIILSYRGLSGRRAQGVIQELYDNGYIDTAPSPTVIWRFMDYENLSEILRVLIQISATPAIAAETRLAIDASGFRTTSYSDWFGEKHGYEKVNEWIKLHAIVGVETNVIANAYVTDGHTHDNKMFKPLVEEVVQQFTVTEVSADKGYLARDNFNLCKDYGIRLFVPFKTSSTPAARGSGEWTKMYYYALENPEEFKKHYHKRSNVETVFHMMKATGQETIRSRKFRTQSNELYCKVICHNIRMLIMLNATQGLEPEFVEFE